MMRERASARDSRPLYFLHIPKTAGTTVSVYLESGFQREEICPAPSWAELLRLPSAEMSGYRLYCGHFGAMLLDLLPTRPAVVTMLRDPVDRLVSYWSYVLRHPSHPEHPRVAGGDADFATFVCTRLPNSQTRALAVDTVPRPLLARFRNTRRAPLEVEEDFARWTLGHPDLLERAVARLHECVAFGIVDRFDDSIALLAHSLGWAPPTGAAQLNARPAKERLYEPSAEDVELVRQRNALDCALVDAARAIFEHRRQAAMADSPHASYEQAIAEKAVPLHAPLLIDARKPLDGTGWLAPIDPHLGHARWMGPAGPATIDVPVIVPEGTGLELFCGAAVSALVRNSCRVALDGADIPLSVEPWGTGFLLTGSVPRRIGTASPYSSISIRVAETAPFEIAMPLPDVLHLGLALSWVRLVPPGVLSPPPPAPADGPFHRLVIDGVLKSERSLRAHKAASERSGLRRTPDRGRHTVTHAS
jgi:hypothetical protein